MKSLFYILLFSASFYCDAQIPDYYVFLIKGEASVFRQGDKPALLKQRSFIYKDQLITLKKDAELTMVDKDQNFFVLRSAGVFKVKDLVKQTAAQMPGVTQKYLKLVWNELFNPHHDYTKFTKENVAGVYGGVSRGDECHNLIFPLNNLRTSGDSMHFTWLQTSSSSSYAFIIYDSERKEIVNIPVKDTQQTIDLSKSLNAEYGNYYWLVKGEKAVCEDEMPLHFEWISAANEQKFISSLLHDDSSTRDLSARLQAIDKLEKNALIPAAAKFYSALVNDNPGDDALLKSYVAFLLKYGYEENADKLWKKMNVKE